MSTLATIRETPGIEAYLEQLEVRLEQAGEAGPPGARGGSPPPPPPEERPPAGPGGEPIRALIPSAATPVLSAPDGDRLDKALDGLDFMVSIDPYLNETTRHADVVLPPPPPSQSAHHDFAFNTLAVRNQVRYTRPAVPLEPGRMAETEIFARLVLAATGMHGADPSAVDDLVIGQTLGKAVTDPYSPVPGRDPRDEAVAADLLVIQGVHPTVAEAEAALREAGTVAEGGGRRAGWWSTVRREAYLLGLVTPEDRPRGKARTAAVWTGMLALVLVGFAVPFV